MNQFDYLKKKFNDIYKENYTFNDYIKDNAYDIILESGLFDEEWYSNAYPDVSENNFDLINHYLSVGVEEGCRPNPNFDSHGYLTYYTDVKKENMNPLLHYIIFGRDENRLTDFSNLFFPTAEFFKGNQVDCIFEALKKKISIIIPVYNKLEDLKKCIESVLKNTVGNYELILINNSYDKKIKYYLDNLSNNNDLIRISNDENKSFFENINLELNISDSDVVLLNSDTIVTYKWLQKLIISAYSKDNVGTVTPLSNNAGLCSVPNINEFNNIPDNLTIEDISNIIEKSSNKLFMNVPIGNAFCMYIKRDTINTLGSLDKNVIEGDYAEEYCFYRRLSDNGWINLIDDSTYIFHKDNSSLNEYDGFDGNNLKMSNEKYHIYNKSIKSFLESDGIKSISNSVTNALTNYDSLKFNKKRILYVMHDAIGGTPKTNKDLMGVVEGFYDCYLLTSDGNEMILYHFVDNHSSVIEKWKLNTEWIAERFFIEEFRDIYFNILIKYSIDLIHIRHLIYHSFDLPYVADNLNIPLVLSFHDFYFICVSYNLLDGNNIYCGGKCGGNYDCNISLNNFTNFYNVNKFVHIWREAISNMFNKINCFVTTSDIVKNIFAECYPSMDLDNFYVIEHGRDFNELDEDLFEVPSLNNPIKILFIGNINIQKGSEIINELNEVDKENRLELHFLGNTIWELEKVGIHHGTYDRDNLVNEIKKINPSFIGIFSIWPETYCHTLSEAWASGIPVLSTKIGVLEDRVNSCCGGWFIDMANIENTYNMILDISNNEEEYLSKIDDVKNIAFKSIQEMGNDYLDIYNGLLLNEDDSI